MKKHMMIKLTLLGLFFITIVGCNKGPTAEEEIYNVLEDVVKLEDTFKEQQNPLVELEQKEKDLYDEIISLSMKDFDQIVELSNEALSVVDERKERINSEFESIQESKAKFETVMVNIEKLENEELKQEALNLVDLMNNRYSSYDELYSSYNDAINLDKELYELFQDEGLDIEVLQGQIDKINESYDKVIAANEQFNEYTENYNQAKITFYKNAGLEVVYEGANE